MTDITKENRAYLASARGDALAHMSFYKTCHRPVHVAMVKISIGELELNCGAHVTYGHGLQRAITG